VHATELRCWFQPLTFPARRRYVRVIQHEASEAVRHAAPINEPGRWRLDAPQSLIIKTCERCESVER
jgi:hypothetical protein